MWNTSTSSNSSSGAQWYRKERVIRRKLKSMFMLKHEFNFKRPYGGGDGMPDEWEDDRMDWLINEEMAPKFGDGNYYSFELSEGGRNNQYTHSHDGYYYHELWFIDDNEEVGKLIPLIKLDEEDFLL